MQRKQRRHEDNVSLSNSKLRTACFKESIQSTSSCDSTHNYFCPWAKLAWSVDLLQGSPLRANQQNILPRLQIWNNFDRKGAESSVTWLLRRYRPFCQCFQAFHLVKSSAVMNVSGGELKNDLVFKEWINTLIALKPAVFPCFLSRSIHNGLIFLRLNWFYDQHRLLDVSNTPTLIIAGKCRHFGGFSSLYHWTGFKLVSVFHFWPVLAATSQKAFQIRPKDLGRTGSLLGRLCHFPNLTRLTCCCFLSINAERCTCRSKYSFYKYRKIPDCKQLEMVR